jgi:hypothetical protein
MGIIFTFNLLICSHMFSHYFHTYNKMTCFPVFSVLKMQFSHGVLYFVYYFRADITFLYFFLIVSHIFPYLFPH